MERLADKDPKATRVPEGRAPRKSPAHRDARQVVLASLILTFAGAVPRVGAQERPTFPSGIALVKVDVVVVDRDGKPVRGLTREDFRVFDEGRERPVVSFEAVVAPPPMTEAEVAAKPPRVSTNVVDGAPFAKPLLLFVLDGMRPSPMGTLRATKALREFVDVNPGLDADVTFASTDSAKTWTGRARDLRAPGDFDRVISAVLGPPAPTGASLDPRGLNPGVVPGVPFGARASMGRMAEEARAKALAELIERFSAGRAGRTTMILLAEGVIAGPFNRKTNDIIGLAARHRVVIYGLDVRGLTAPATGADRASLPDTDGEGARPRFSMDSSDSWAEELAHATGGRNVRGTERLGVALAGFVEESLSYYLLGFEPDARAQPGRLRSMKVKLAPGDYEVRARPAYILPRPGEGPLVGLPLPLAVAAFVGGLAKEGRSIVRLVLEVDPSALEPAPGDAGGRVTLESQIDFVPMAGGKARRDEYRNEVKLTPPLRKSLGDAWLPLARDVDLGPGRYEARVVLRDPATGRSGTVKHAFEVPVAGALRLTTPVISDLFHPDGSPREIARARFDPARVVECAFQALGATPVRGGQPHLLARWSLRSPAGEEVQHGETEGAGTGRARFAFPLPLAALGDGAYTLFLTVRDTASGATAEGEERVEVARRSRSGPR